MARSVLTSIAEEVSLDTAFEDGCLCNPCHSELNKIKKEEDMLANLRDSVKKKLLSSHHGAAHLATAPMMSVDTEESTQQASTTQHQAKRHCQGLSSQTSVSPEVQVRLFE